MPHSPSQRNYSGVPGMDGIDVGSTSGSDSPGSDSNISDMVIDVKTKFANVKSRHRKSQDGEFMPSPGSSSKTISESDSDSSSASKSGGDLVIADEENKSVYSSSTTNSQSMSPRRSKGQAAASSNNTTSFYRRKVGQAPRINRDSPFKFNRTKTSSKYSYELCPPSFDLLPPPRRAATKVRYNYSDESDQSKDSDVLPRRPARRGNRVKSDSEFEMTGESEMEQSNNDSSIDEDNSSGDDYQRSRSRGSKRKGRKKVSFCVKGLLLHTLCV